MAAAWLIGGVALVAIVVTAARLLGDASSEEPAASSAGLPDPGEVYDPVKAGEPLPDGYRRLLDRDQILPVYEPVFTSPGQIDWPPDSLVIGVAGSKNAKAYPVTHLNRREMVIDVLEGTPILVSW